MPSTPRMIEIERKASTPGEGLSQADITLWHREHLGQGSSGGRSGVILNGSVMSGDLSDWERSFIASTYDKPPRYLDTPGWKARP